LDAYPLPVSSVAAAIKVLAPDNLRFAEENRQKLINERDRIIPLIEQNELVELVYPSDANFILVKMKSAREFVSFCQNNGVILRDFSDKPRTKDCIRISISVPEHNNRLLELLQDFSDSQ
jgi:histidinol-phosphate aminotransferase